jgi:hypothetical protein
MNFTLHFFPYQNECSFMPINFTKKNGNKRLKAALTFINRKEKLDQRSSKVILIQQLRGPNFTKF